MYTHTGVHKFSKSLRATS